MPAGFEAAFPPDDTGRTTYERFRYQAHVAFRFCLEAATGGDVLAVVCEHFEDVAVQRSDGWRMVQIKTRDAELPPWRLTDLVGKSGALRGLYRTHKALKDLNGGGGHDCWFEARLEGAVARGDDAEALTAKGGSLTDEVVKRCAKQLELSEGAAKEFLAKVLVIDREPPREFIEGVMRDLLRRAAPGLSGAQIAAIYNNVFSKIESAMEGKLLAEQFPAVLVQPATADEAAAKLVDSKKLDRSTLMGLFGSLTASPALLAEIADPALLAATALERKLRLVGAEALVDDAKKLRANAAIREAEVLSAGFGGEQDVLSDVRSRLKLVGNSEVAAVSADPPGPAVWQGVMSRLGSEGKALDKTGIFDADQMLLLGELCQVSDMCEFGWGGDA